MRLSVAAALLVVLGAAVPARAQASGGGSAAAEPRVSSRELLAAAAASPRPAECAPTAPRRANARSTWERARRPAERTFCDALARGYASLNRSPPAALEAVERAERALPGRAATSVLEGRALLAMGSADSAYKALRRAQSRDRRSVEAPQAMHDLAVAALLSGQRAVALSTYRRLVPRASLLPDVHRRQRVLLEASLVVMGEGSAALDEALGYLAEARRQRGVPGLGSVVLGALALALDRQGRSEEARGVVAEAGAPLGTVTLASSPNAGKVVAASAGELHAIAALLVEQSHPDTAKSEWEAYLASEAGRSGPWAQHARGRLDALGGARRDRGPRRSPPGASR